MGGEETVASRSMIVTERDTARGWGDDFPEAASTPFVLGLAETACHEILARTLSDFEITVGTSATIRHLAASRIGATLVATATLVDRSGRRASFSVEVRDGGRVVAEVEHTRAVVLRAVIEERLRDS